METTEKLVYGFLGISVIVALFAMLTAFQFFSFSENAASTQQNPMGERLTRMSLTSFDVVLAHEFMDKNGDGQCDVCGMDIQLCMDSGQIQCNMDSKTTIGILGSQHIHADWKIYVNAEPFDWSPYGDLHEKQMMGDTSIKDTSAFIHIHPSQLPEKAGDILHMHATGVPLWIFFKSVGMDFNKDCLSLPDGQKFCNDGKNTLKFYVNGKPNSEWENYVFNDLDEILISYGSETELTDQLNSITDFAKNH